MMYPDTVTIWNRLGEKDRKEQWKRTVLNDVRVEEKSGAYRRTGGDQSADANLVLIPDAIGYVDPDVFTGEGETWTARETDKVAKGASTDPVPPDSAWSVQYAEPIRLDYSIHHLEVHAQ